MGGKHYGDPVLDQLIDMARPGASPTLATGARAPLRFRRAVGGASPAQPPGLVLEAFRATRPAAGALSDNGLFPPQAAGLSLVQHE